MKNEKEIFFGKVTVTDPKTNLPKSGFVRVLVDQSALEGFARQALRNVNGTAKVGPFRAKVGTGIQRKPFDSPEQADRALKPGAITPRITTRETLQFAEAKHHQAADARMGRNWNSAEGCHCASCCTIRGLGWTSASIEQQALADAEAMAQAAGKVPGWYRREQD